MLTSLIIPATALEAGEDTVPGITQETEENEDTYCGYVVHTHTDDCYEVHKDLICGFEEGQEIPLDPVIHTHTDACWQETETVLESGETVTEKVLVCGYEEGQEIPQSTIHQHTDECYQETTVLICTIEEHQHTDICYSDQTADVENYSDWAAIVYGLDMTGNWAEDVVMLAKSQIGYHDSEKNFVITNSGNKQYYSRYGAWYGLPYEEWCAMFVSFCLYYAGIPQEVMPSSAGCTNWAEKYKTMGLFYEAPGEYQPQPGDLVFFRYPESESGCDHVGIVEKAENGNVYTIEGNITHAVVQNSYAQNDPVIVGYVKIPEKPVSTEPAPGEESSEPGMNEEPRENSMNSEPEDSGESSEISEPADPTENSTVQEPAVTEESSAEGSSVPEVTYPAVTLEAETEDGTRVIVEAPEGAFPEGTGLFVKTVELEKVAETISDAVEGNVVFTTAVDITFLNAQKTEIEPKLPIQVQIIPKEIPAEIVPEEATAQLVHIDDDGKGEVVEQVEETRKDSSSVTFESDDFSIYVVAYTIDYYYQSVSGETFRITLTYTEDALIPEDATLEVREILPGTEEYAEYLSQIGVTEEEVHYARFFDITIVDANGNHIQPAEGSSVNVQIRLLDAESEEMKVIHFGETLEIIDSAVEKTEEGIDISFDATGFSVYAIVDSIEPYSSEIKTVASLDELKLNTSEGFILSVTRNLTIQYFTSDMNSNNCFVVNSNPTKAAVWYFEPVAGETNQYYIYTLINGDRNYMKRKISTNSRKLMELTTDTDLRSAFVLSNGEKTGTFYFKLVAENEDLWLQYSGSGGGIRLWEDVNNKDNSCITLTYASSYILPQDYYGLDGHTYGIAYHNDTATSAAMTTDAITVSNNQRLEGQEMVMKPDVLDNEGILLVAENSDITFWTFTCIETNKYYITTKVGDATKYLSINRANVSLVDTPNDKCVITITPGTGENQGKYHFSVDGYSLNLPNGASKGFGAANSSAATTWMNVVKNSAMPEEDFTLFTARKVSVSDVTEVYDQAKVVIYTRVWNDTKKKYEFYAIAHDGALIPAYDIGDGVEWTGSKVDSTVWTFTEYLDAQTNKPNDYYELQNVQYGEFIAPQVTSGQILSDYKIGVNLNGRKYGQKYTTIIAWDGANYAYAGLRANVTTGRIESCSLSEADDFYFAITNDPVAVSGELTQVSTADSSAYGIRMWMIDYNQKPTTDNREPRQKSYFGGDTGADGGSEGTGLLSTYLVYKEYDGEEVGYPVSTSRTAEEGVSLSKLYRDNGDQWFEVNNLFLESIYNESGYFEYNSTQNFAHLIVDPNDPWIGKEMPDGGTYAMHDFVIYDQLGAIVGSNELKTTRTHGQFMPFNDISENNPAYTTLSNNMDENGNPVPITNQTDVFANELPDVDPRKGEQLYRIGCAEANSTDYVDYFFGMELEATFTQTVSGLDAWGHDIVFEFSGDDDFWLYVDGELVLDLGGVHPAQVGSVNFRTGQVTSSNGDSTLYDRFKSNYEGRNPEATEEDVANYLNDIFTLNEEGNYVFKDYTNHTMRIFYMERGSGASNLHMRFNLAAVKPGSFILSKQLSGTDHSANDLIEFPYQICYYSTLDGENRLHYLGEELGDDAEGTDAVLFAETIAQVPFQKSFTPAGGTKEYKNVFFLKPGQFAEVSLPADATSYFVVECGVNPDIYDRVTVNGETVTGQKTDNLVGTTKREDYITSKKTLKERTRVIYDNHVHEGAMRTLTITKRLFDVDGVTQLHYPSSDYAEGTHDASVFNFRLYLGTENADPNELPAAYVYTYYVKDDKDNYCRWNAATQGFDSLGITDYSVLAEYLKTLTGAQKDAIVFKTSQNGSISKIPADYTVEVRDLIAGTQWKVEERDWEIPRGYTRRINDGYVLIGSDETPNVEQEEPVHGTIMTGKDPQTEVRNQRGWGLTVKKVWTDKDFMQSHGDIFFAVYLDEELLTNSVRRFTSADDDVYYFFDDCYDENGVSHDFSEYVVREVKVTTTSPEGLSVDADGVVDVSDTAVVTVEPIPEGEQLEVDGTEANGTYRDKISYTVNYTQGQPTGHNNNVRTDIVTNSRPGIALYKTDDSGDPIAGAVFTLKDANGNDVAAESYTSDVDGRITIAYMSPGVYTLTETVAPKRYVGLTAPVYITVNDDGSATVTSSDMSMITVSYADTSMAVTVSIKNMPISLEVVKVRADDEEPIENVHFALYRQVINIYGELVKDYLPIPGYDDLVTNADGILTEINLNNPDLKVGVYYYLTETQPFEGYAILEDDLEFTINANGTITIYNDEFKTWLKREEVNGTFKYTITIPNGEATKVSFTKVDSTDGSALGGAIFDLYRVRLDENGEETKKMLYSGLTSRDSDGILELNGGVIFALPYGTYHLVETQAPAGYNRLDGPVVITVSDTGNGDEVLSDNDREVTYSSETEIFAVTVANTRGFVLPLTGGTGTNRFYAIASILILGSALVIFGKRRKKKA